MRHIKTALQNEFTNKIDLADYSGRPEDEREKVFLSRALAAYAVQSVLPLDNETAAKTVCDGYGDNGLDAIAFDSDTRQVLVVQSKWDEAGNSAPALGDVQKFIQGFRDLINARFERFNDKVRARQGELNTALDDPNVTFLLLLAHTGQQALSSEATNVFDDLLQELNDTTDVVQYRHLRQADFHRQVQSHVEGAKINLDLHLTDWGVVQEPITAYYGQVSGTEVAAWFAAHGSALFSKNLRRLLPDSEVNASLIATLTQDPTNFWYYNNGITALCESVRKKPIGGADRKVGEFALEGVSIVNGAQTVGCIATAADKSPEKVAEARVSIRCISLEDCPEGFATEVTRATNTQNRVERRDFVALDPQQERLRTELQLENGKYYAIKSGEPDPEPATGCSVIDATIALACASDDPNLAVQAKREIGRLWENLDKPPYRSIFNSGVSGLKLWRAVEVLRLVDTALRSEQTKRTGRERSIAIQGNRLVLHLVFRSLATKKMGTPDFDWDSQLKAVPSVTLDALEKTIEFVESEYANNYLTSLFKNASRCRSIVAEVLPKLEPVS